ncbi:MAG: hypothetical protein GY769_18825 [bacterium]|nr:hypothetical protein [bacterium]
MALLYLLAQSVSAEDASREYQRQLAKAAKEYPLVVAALLHAQEDAKRFAELAMSLAPATVRHSHAQAQMCLWSCQLKPDQAVCSGCSEPARTDQRSCPNCGPVCDFSSVLGTQVNCADCMIQRGDNGCP